MVNLLDVATTIIYKWYSPYFNEANPYYVSGMPIWVLFLIKIAIALYLVWVIAKKYHIQSGAFWRYIIIYCVCLLFFLNLGVVINNVNAISQLSDTEIVIQEIPNDVKVQMYKEAVYDMGLVKTNNTPIIVTMFIINCCQFLLWLNFEKWRKKKLTRY